ncbi:MAG: alpha-ribazole phosphatase [Methylophilaceae bacterium]|nr:alpha-ribazole phosphatase [Methylophilaceae bacterium]
MNIYLVRHTKPDVDVGVCYGLTDIDVADSFEAELCLLKDKVAHISQPLVFSSPLKRCSKLAEQLAAHLDATHVKTDVRLSELNFGDWELQNWADIPQGVVEEWTDDHIKQAPPNGESYIDLHHRAKQFFEELKSNQEGRHALVVTHAGVIRALVAEAMNLPLREACKVEVGYGSVTLIIIEDGVTQVAFVNR